MIILYFEEKNKSKIHIEKSIDEISFRDQTSYFYDKFSSVKFRNKQLKFYPTES